MKQRQFSERDHEQAARLFNKHYGDLSDYEWFSRADRETAKLAEERPDMQVAEIVHAAGQKVRSEKIEAGRRKAVGDIINERNKLKEGKR